MDKNALVVKSNALIETSYRLTMNEQRILLACISQVRRDEALTDQIMYSVSAQELSELSGGDIKTTYRDLKTAALALKRREVRITKEPNGKGRRKTLIASWVQSIEYSDGAGVVSLRFNHDIIPYLSELNKCFTSYRLKSIATMSSIYGVRLYELLVQWGPISERTIPIQWLREVFQLENKYPQVGDLKRRVLDPAINDINKNSDLWVEVTQKKTGRKITHLVFNFGLKEESPAKKKANEKKHLGIKQSVIEKNARPGETYEQAAIRLKKKTSRTDNRSPA